MCMSRPMQRDVAELRGDAWRRAPTSSYGMPNLWPRPPVLMYSCGVSSVTSGLTRSDTRAVIPRSRASRSISRTSASLSALIRRTSASSASASSRSVLPTPPKMMSRAAKPARSARRSSPPDTTSTPAPELTQHVEQTAARVRLERIVNSVRHAARARRRAARTGRESSPRCRRTPACRLRGDRARAARPRTASAAVDARKAGAQYAFAHTASASPRARS